jgi:hypothetical protein
MDLDPLDAYMDALAATGDVAVQESDGDSALPSSWRRCFGGERCDRAAAATAAPEAASGRPSAAASPLPAALSAAHQAAITELCGVVYARIHGEPTEHDASASGRVPSSTAAEEAALPRAVHIATVSMQSLQQLLLRDPALFVGTWLHNAVACMMLGSGNGFPRLMLMLVL